MEDTDFPPLEGESKVVIFASTASQLILSTVYLLRIVFTVLNILLYEVSSK